MYLEPAKVEDELENGEEGHINVRHLPVQQQQHVVQCTCPVPSCTTTTCCTMYMSCTFLYNNNNMLYNVHVLYLPVQQNMCVFLLTDTLFL